MFATYYSHSLLPVAPALAPFAGIAAPSAQQNERLVIKIPSKETLVQARPKIGLRPRKAGYAPPPEQVAMPMITAPTEFVVPLSAPAPQQASAAPASPPRIYGRPRRPPASVRHSRRVTPASPSGSSKSSAARASQTETFESITCAPPFTSTSFEELRVECYSMSYVATGHAPMPVTPDSAQWDTIPPFYSPVVQEVTEVSGFGPSSPDVTMSDGSDPDTPFAFAFNSGMAFSAMDTSVSDAGDTSMEY